MIHLHFTSGIFGLQVYKVYKVYTVFSIREKLPSLSKIYAGVAIFKNILLSLKINWSKWIIILYYII